MKRLSANILSIVASDLGRRLLGFFAVAYLARTVGVSGFGLINIGFAVLSYAMMVSGGGLGPYGARAIARGDSPGIASAIAGVRLVASGVIFLLVALGALLLVPDRQTAIIIVVFLLSQFANTFLLDWYFQGKEQMSVVGAARLVSAAVYLLFLIMFVGSAADLLWVAIAAVAGDALGAMVTVARFQKVSGASLGISLRGGRALFREAFPIGIGSMIAHMTVNLPTIILGIFLTNADAGTYSAAGKLVFFLLVFDRLLSTLLLPASSRYFAQSPEKLSEMLTTALRWVLRIALPLCVGGTILADRIIPLVYGPAYGAAADVLRILIWFLLLTMVHTVYTAGLLASGREKQYGRVMVMSGLVYAVSVCCCTWYYGVAGAAVGIVVSELATLVLMQREAAQCVSVRPDRPSLVAFGAAAAMGGVLLAMPPFHPLVLVVIGALAYAIVLVALRGISLREFSVFVERPA